MSSCLWHIYWSLSRLKRYTYLLYESFKVPRQSKLNNSQRSATITQNKKRILKNCSKANKKHFHEDIHRDQNPKTSINVYFKRFNPKQTKMFADKQLTFKDTYLL